MPRAEGLHVSKAVYISLRMICGGGCQWVQRRGSTPKPIFQTLDLRTPLVHEKSGQQETSCHSRLSLQLLIKRPSVSQRRQASHNAHQLMGIIVILISSYPSQSHCLAMQHTTNHTNKAATPMASPSPIRASYVHLFRAMAPAVPPSCPSPPSSP